MSFSKSNFIEDHFNLMKEATRCLQTARYNLNKTVRAKKFRERGLLKRNDHVTITIHKNLTPDWWNKITIVMNSDKLKVDFCGG